MMCMYRWPRLVIVNGCTAEVNDKETYALHWRHNEHDGVSNHRRFDYFAQPFAQVHIKSSKLRVIGLCDGSKAYNISIQRHNVFNVLHAKQLPLNVY